VIQFTTTVEPAEAKAGEKVLLKVKVKLEPGWHIFQYATSWSGDGPKPTLFDTFDLGGLIAQGDWKSSTAPIQKKDPNFPDLEKVEFFEDEATWTLSLEVPAGTPEGQKTIRVQAGYQICSSELCNPPGQWTLPDASLKIIAGGAIAASPAPTTKPVAKEPTPERVVSEIEKTAQAGLIPFLLACAGAGLLALAMPCVWPMIPVTVNFFVKQGEKDKGRATRLAVAYCLAIIGIFTLIGLLFSAILGAGSLNTLAPSA
jgi:thiol:disulfide interchange protein DsbD